MRIIDKNKDYYDYLAHQPDSDDGVTFDRRGSIPLRSEDFFNILSEHVKHHKYYRVPKDGLEPIKVKDEHIFINTSSALEFFVPAELEKDKQYAIRICTQFSSWRVTVKGPHITETDFYLKAV